MGQLSPANVNAAAVNPAASDSAPPANPTSDQHRAGTHERPVLRLDIQGLRAVAVVAVVVFHLWPTALPGGFIGVDVFFVISGYLITSHLLHTPPRSGADLASFWRRRIRRLLPASLLVLFCTLVMTALVAPITQWTRTAEQVITSAVYVQNWRLAADSVNYLRADNVPTAVQHFWSLSVEEQFYLIWPVLILLVVGLAGLLRWHAIRVVAVAMALTVLVSFVASVWLTWQDPARAYFSTPVRIWELGAGGLLAAVVMSSARSPRGGPIWSLVAAAGLLAIGVAAWTYSPATPFPSWQAALPVVGSVAVIAAGTFRGRSVASKFLGVSPLPYLGDISYSIYLWHWPLIVLVPYLSGDRLGPLDRTGIVLATVVLAALTKRFVEDPFRRPGVRGPGVRGRRGGPFGFAALGMAVVVAAGVAVQYDVDRRSAYAAQAHPTAISSGDRCFGARAMALGIEQCPYQSNVEPVPFVADAPDDRTVAYADDCWSNPPFSQVRTCRYGSPTARVSIALVGNSHAGHWLPSLQELMEQYDFSVTTYLASACNVTTTEMRWNPRSDGTGCLAWAEKVMVETTHGGFDLVVTSAIQTHLANAATSYAQGYDLAEIGHLDMLRRWAAAGVDVMVLRDTPRAPNSFGEIPDCVAIHAGDLVRCSGPRTEWLHDDPLAAAATSINIPEVSTVDLTEFFCDQQTCYGVIGGVIAFTDTNHMTQTYARTLAPYLAGPLAVAIQRATAP